MKVMRSIVRWVLPAALVVPFGVALLGEPGADMSVSVLADKRHAHAGELVTYTTRVRNLGSALKRKPSLGTHWDSRLS